MGKIRRAIGLMSGTSMDGIDIAALETDGDAHVSRLGGASVPYEPAFRDRLRSAVDAASDLVDRGARPGVLADVERALTERHVQAVIEFLKDMNWSPVDVDVVGFHGQTVLHRPEQRLTVQLGDGEKLSTAIGIPVVFDLRAEDVAAGGQGAPFAPVYHRAMCAKLPDRPIAIVNIGGVANISWIGPHEELTAFDTGPGNALLDDWMQERCGQACDMDGRAGGTGRVMAEELEGLLSHPYFFLTPPKSLDRNAFDVGSLAGLSLEDGAATLTCLTAETIARAVRQLPKEPELWIICGGGRWNRTLMAMLAERVENAVVPAEAVGFDGDLVEAETWAYLAARSMDGSAISFPGTTGVPEPMTGGVLVGSRS